MTVCDALLTRIPIRGITDRLNINILLNMQLCNLHIVELLNYQLDTNKTPVNVYLDLSKAFDSLSHKILLDKIKILVSLT